MICADPWFMGVLLQYGPDGAVYVSDWSDTGECHSYKNTQRGTGRIYKIAYGHRPPADVDIGGLDDRQLVQLMLHPNDWHVRHARRVLQERSATGRDMSAVHAQLVNMFEQHPDVTRKLRALWALHLTGGAGSTFLQQQLKHDNEYIRSWAIRLMCEDQRASAPVLKMFAVMATRDASPLVRLHLASALQRLPVSDRWEIAAGLISHQEDIDDPNIPLVTWYGIEPLVTLDKARALQLVRQSQIPLIRQFITRRAATAARKPSR
jgi:hypothetical protein